MRRSAAIARLASCGVRSADASCGTRVHDLGNLPPFRLRWRWRLGQSPSGGTVLPDLASKAGDDATLEVCAIRAHSIERVPFVERTVLRLARRLSGEPLPAATLCEVWDSGGAAGPADARREVPRVSAVLIGADSDDTASRSSDWVAGPQGFANPEIG